MRTNEQSWALLSIDDHGAKALRVLKAPWGHAQEFLLALISALGAMVSSSWVLIAAFECLWLLMSAQKCPWMLFSVQECSWRHAYACSWLLMSIHEPSRALIRSHEHGAMGPTALMSAKEHAWDCCYGAITPRSALARYLSMLMSAQECSLVPTGALEFSRLFLSYIECSCSWFSNKQKMLIFMMTSF